MGVVPGAQFNRAIAAFSAVAKQTQAVYGSSSRLDGRSTRHASATVATIDASSTAMITSAAVGARRPKNTGVHAKLSASWTHHAPSAMRAPGARRQRHSLQPAMPIIA